ncbi:MAG TPA: cation:proton antiporter [Candidatus Limnocylindrales bacterium]|nr:cation:proton antiporter [Candidatus Limnocylindrales bacterium]
MEASTLPIFELGVLLLLAASAGWIARRVRLPAIVGYLGVGVLVSPFTPGYVADHEQLQLLADVGVVLLLFEVGIEVDVVRLRREHGQLLWAAPLQTIITTIVATAAALAGGLPPFGAGAVGIGVAMSSSVVIVNITRSRRRTTTPETEQALLGWSVLQDITGVALSVLLLAVYGSAARPPLIAFGGLIAFAAIAVVAGLVLAQVLRRLGAEHDLFLIVSVATGLALAGAGAVVAGIPLALAAFVAGLAVAETPESAEARRRLLPFRDVFAVLFFVAIGTLIDPEKLSDGLGWLALIVGLVIVAKVFVATALARFVGLRGQPVQLGIGLGQIGEFSFVLGSTAVAAGAIGIEVYEAILGAVVVTIIGSTVLVRAFGGNSRETQPAPAEG